jgi:hypothetical protein
MNRMTQTAAPRLNSWAKPDANYSGRDELECFQQGCQADLWWGVLVTNHDRGLAFRAIVFLQLEAVADKADVALVWVEEIDGPILGLVPVVTEWTSEFELESPPAWDQQVRRSLCPDRPGISGQRIEIPSDGRQQLWLAVRAYPHLKRLERHSTAIDGDQRCGDVLNDLV